jgi:hypothetical protein
MMDRGPFYRPDRSAHAAVQKEKKKKVIKSTGEKRLKRQFCLRGEKKETACH